MRWKISTNTVYGYKTDTKCAHSVRGRPTLKDEERYRNGLVRKPYERSLYEGISSANDLIQIMNIGNQCYSSLSRLARHAFLKQSELPTALNVFDTDYQLEYSESYSATVHQDAAIQGYQYCTSLQRAFELRRSENYTNFILTVRCIAVAIYCNGNMGFKIFDSHARDLYGRGQPQGTCVLLEVPYLDS